jgi:hypothetical protein
MSKQPPDFSFEREGRPLADWLLDLVSEEAPARLQAGEALLAMMHGVPSVHTDGPTLTVDLSAPAPQAKRAGVDRSEAAALADRSILPRLPLR